MSDIECYAIYESNGRISGVLSCPPGMGEANIRLNTNLPAIQVPCMVSPDEHYVVDGDLRSRPDGLGTLNGHLLSGVPASATVTIEGQEYITDGTDIELGFSAPGTYLVTVTLWPYRDQEFTVENPA